MHAGNAKPQAPLPSGDEVERLWIVVPLREHAVAVHDRAVGAGFEAAVDPATGDELWTPVAKGRWLEESTDDGIDVTP